MIRDIVDAITRATAAYDGPRPFVVGIAGGVGVGKTTLATTLADLLRATGVTVAVVATDSFLHPNEELDRRGLLMRKGFPDTYDVDSIQQAVARLRAGGIAIVPVYSHEVYDRIEETAAVPPTDVLLLEGVNVLQPPVTDVLDLSVYIDVEHEHARDWFFTRFERLCAEGAGFYAPLASMTAEQRRAIATSAWEGINLVNLVEHIEPTRARADLIVRKEADHTVVEVARQGRSA